MGKGPEEKFSKEDIHTGPQKHRKMLNITNHQRNTNQSHNDTSHLSEKLL